MKCRVCFQLAICNLLAKRRVSRKLLRGITTIAVLAISVMQLSYGLHIGYEQKIASAESGNYIEYQLPLNESGMLAEPALYDKIKAACASLSQIGENSVSGWFSMPEYLHHSNWTLVNIKHITTVIDDVPYLGKNDYSYDFVTPFDSNAPQSQYTVPFAVSLVDPQTESFSRNLKAEAAYRFNASAFLCGRDIQQANELLITDYMLFRLGYSGDPAALLGSRISFLFDGEEVISGCTLVGVTNAALYRVSHVPQIEQIMLGADASMYAKYGVDSLSLLLPVDDYRNTNAAIDALNQTDCGVFGFPVDTDQYVFIARLQAIVNHIVSLFCALLVLALLLNLGSTLGLSIREKRHYFGMCKANGMHARDLRRMSFFELFVITALAVPLACGLSFVLMALLEQIMLVQIGLQLIPSFYVCAAIAGMVWACLLVVLCLMEWTFLRPILRRPASVSLS